MATAAIPAIVEVARLRAKNQLTLPDSVARAIGAEPGDRLRIWVEEDGVVRLQKVPVSMAGAFRGVWGNTSEEIAAHLDGLRNEWERDAQP